MDTNIYTKLKIDILSIIEKLYGIKIPNNNISIELPKNQNHGDLSSNAAMIISREIQKPPREIANNMLTELDKISYIAKTEIAGAGFLNFTITKEELYRRLYQIFEFGNVYGKNNIGNNIKVNVEYVSANPTGPLHIGHARGAIYGDVLSNLLKYSGYLVTKEYYVNDAGGQVNDLALSVFIRYKEISTGVKGELPPNLYPGEYIIEVAKNLYKKYQDKLLDNKEKSFEIIKEFAIKSMLDLIKNDLNNLGINHDVFFSEKSLHDTKKIDSAISELLSKDLVYEGFLEKPKGKTDEEWSMRKQLLFKSKNFGDDSDRALKKEDGSWTYFAADAAYARDKIKRGYDYLIYILGADHGGYVKRTKAVINSFSDNRVVADIKICQLVNYIMEGSKVKMSKRSGNFSSVNDIYKELGKDVIRFMMLTRKNDIVLDFDINQVKTSSKDNPVFYVQYAAVRANSVLKKASNIGIEMKNLNCENLNLNLNLINLPMEIELIKSLISYPNIIESSARNFEPHRIAYYLQNLASKYHSLWNHNDLNIKYKFIDPENIELSRSRVFFSMLIRQVLVNGLKILGIEALESM